MIFNEKCQNRNLTKGIFRFSVNILDLVKGQKAYAKLKQIGSYFEKDHLYFIFWDVSSQKSVYKLIKYH